MELLSHTDLRKGTKVIIDNQPWLIVDSDFVKPGKGSAFTRCRVKNFFSGSVIERTFKSHDKVERADVEGRYCQYLYGDGESYHFMDGTTYDQVAVPSDTVGDAAKWLVENMSCLVQFWGEKPITVEPPNSVELEIVECDPGVRGDTAQGGGKKAKLSTGAVVDVPLFVSQGEWVKVDTRSGEYIERVKR